MTKKPRRHAGQMLVEYASKLNHEQLCDFVTEFKARYPRAAEFMRRELQGTQVSAPRLPFTTEAATPPAVTDLTPKITWKNDLAGQVSQ